MNRPIDSIDDSIANNHLYQEKRKQPDDHVDELGLATKKISTKEPKRRPLTEEEAAFVEMIKTSCNDPDLLARAVELRIKAMPNARLEEDRNDTEYYVQNGLRKVYPYTYVYQCFVKRRWLGKNLKDLIQSEFRALPEPELQKRFDSRRFLLNGKLTDGNHKLRDSDFITNITHRHELPVLATQIKFIHKSDDMIVIDKPPSVPIHPCGRYRHNSIVWILENEFNFKETFIVHRLDRLVSGVCLVALSKAKACEMEKQISGRDLQKEYVCRVEGEFPDDDWIVVDQPLMTLHSRIGITVVGEQGKPSETRFRRLNYNGKTSAVLCRPVTGRMHQIRVHLQYLGFPILNDPLYNSTAFGETKGKNGHYGKTEQQLLDDIMTEHQREFWILGYKDTISSDDKTQAHDRTTMSEAQREITMKALKNYLTDVSWQDLEARYPYDPSKSKIQEDCLDCKNQYIDPPYSSLFMYLHALSYKGSNWSYESELPEWAKPDWSH